MKPKITREDVIKEVREERQEFSDRMNDEAKGIEVFDLTTSEGRERFLEVYGETYTLAPPDVLEPVLAKIYTHGELGKSEWYEVVYYNGTEWCCYEGSDTFEDGEKVLSWKYCKDIL